MGPCCAVTTDELLDQKLELGNSICRTCPVGIIRESCFYGELLLVKV